MLLYGLLRGDWLEALLGGIALGMSLLPEEFPLVLTVFTVMGAWRLSRSRVLTRRAAAIETLGAATVLCTDKTGTLTRNLMSRGDAADVGAWNGTRTIAARVHCRIAGADAAARNGRAGQRFASRRPDGARPGRPWTARFRARRANGALLREYPLRPELLAMARVWRDSADGVSLAIKGAPEAVAQLCALDRRRARNARRRCRRAGGAWHARAGRGRAQLRQRHLAGSPGWRSRFSCLGLVGFADPLRESVPDAVRECRAAGIRVVMITGDYPATARAIARQAGIEDGECAVGRGPGRCSTTPRSRERVRRRVGVRAHLARRRSCASSTRSRPMARSSR